MQSLPAAGKLQLCSSLSVNALYLSALMETTIIRKVSGDMNL
jgi:hypothetical protein